MFVVPALAGESLRVSKRVENDGTLDLQYNGQQIFNNVQLPGYTPMANGYFALGARTGGASEDAWLDDLKIATTAGSVSTGPTVNISRNADNTITISWTGGGTLQSASSVTGPWNPVAGATSPATLSTTGTMQFFRVAQ
jgi:hypothetical protein